MFPLTLVNRRGVGVGTAQQVSLALFVESKTVWKQLTTPIRAMLGPLRQGW